MPTMNRRSLVLLSIASLLVASGTVACLRSFADEGAVATDAERPDWSAERADNLCGLSDLRALSNPAKVRYGEVMAVTPEIRRINDEHIDPSSPTGIQLKQAAVDRVRAAADLVRVELGHCSVWKQIRHRDGRAIPDLTDRVKARIVAPPTSARPLPSSD